MKTGAPETTSTRWSLIEKLKNWDDRTSWQDFFDSYWRLIYRTATRAGLLDAEAQEVVQETVIAVARKMPGFKVDPAFGSFKGWLLQITRRRIADQFRKRDLAENARHRTKTSTDRTGSTGRVPDPAAVPMEEVWKEEWRQNLFEAALERVKRNAPSKQYKIFFLHVIKEQPALKVCAALKVNIGQVYLAKHRISALLKKEVRRLEKELK
jgi:RNA polymerase sigma-70 factor (ECF subfamily)